MSEVTDSAPVRPAMETVTGIAASRGFAAGPVFVHRPDDVLSAPEYVIDPERVPAELDRYHAAVAEARRQIEQLVADLAERDRAAAEVFSNHLEMVGDATVIAEVERLVREQRLNVESAVRRAVAGIRAVFARMQNEYLRERVRDIDDVERRLLRILLGQGETTSFAQITEPMIVVASDLTPSETVTLPRGLVLGFATERGTATSHVALLARALGIPAVVGLGDFLARVKPGDDILLNGSAGTLTINPDVKTCASFARLVKRGRELFAILDAEGAATAPAEAVPVTFLANAQPGLALKGASALGAQGVGLYRSEYLWLNGTGEPTEDEQTTVYSDAARECAALGPHARLVIRALDIGGDKIRRGTTVREANPFLGQRSIRWLLAHPDALRTQLRAILRASAVAPCAVLWPMVATLEELRAANAALVVAQEELRAEGIPFDAQLPRGCMIELPSAAICADLLAREVDFFSIGTNDLIQYTLAADRGNESVSYLYQPTHPSILRLIAHTTEAARAAGIPVAVCGQTASDPVLAALWAGLGVNELSMSAGDLPVVRAVLRALSRTEVADLAAQALAFAGGRHSAEEIFTACREFLSARIPRFEEILALLT